MTSTSKRHPTSWLLLIICCSFGFDGGECEEPAPDCSNGACEPSTDENCVQQTIATDYEVHFDADTPVTAVDAVFSSDVCGSNLSLRAGQLTYDGFEIDPHTISDRRFEERVEGPFVYINSDGLRFVNNVVFREARPPANFPATIASNRDFELAWDGPPLQEGEFVEVVMWTDGRGLAMGVPVRTETPGDRSVTFTPEIFDDVGSGLSRFLIRRESLFTANAPLAGGLLKISQEYRGPDFMLQ